MTEIEEVVDESNKQQPSKVSGEIVLFFVVFTDLAFSLTTVANLYLNLYL